MNVLVTGSCGFIGYSLCYFLLEKKNIKILGIDNINSYYDQKLKINRLNILKKYNNFKFYKIDLNDKKNLKKIFNSNKIDYIINLAAQAGVRYSIENPYAYYESNISGFFNILNLAKDYKIKHFIYASTSSVYGNSKKFPLKESFNTDNPESLYAATKKCNEILAYSYSNIYKLPSTGLRFFTVYGPYGRPDMALFKFTDSIIKNKKIEVYNYGKHERDWTYIDDIVISIYKILTKIPNKKVPHEIYNIGSNNPKKLMKFIDLIYKKLNKNKKIKFSKFQLGDVKKTHASIFKLSSKINYKPKTSLESGINRFIDWYFQYFNKK